MSFKNILRFPILSVLSIACVFAGSGQTSVITKNTVDSLWRELSIKHNAKDSVTVLYNLYDVYSASEATKAVNDRNISILAQLYDVGLRAQDTLTAFDALRNLVTISRYDLPFVNLQLSKIAHMPNTPEKLETESYLRLQRNIWSLRDTTLTRDERINNFHKLYDQIDSLEKSKSVSLYDRLDKMLAIALYRGNLIASEDMEQDLEELTKLLELTKDSRLPLKSYFYRIVPEMYDAAEAWGKSVEADRKMLEIIEWKNEENLKRGRVFKNYNKQAFTAYRRLLSHYELLEEGEPEAIYQKLQILMKTLPKDQLTDSEVLSVTAMWKMYNKDYYGALKDFKGLMTSQRFRNNPKYIQTYINAAAFTGSKDDLAKGLEMYRDFIEDRANAELQTLRTVGDNATINAAIAKEEARVAAATATKISDDFLKYALIGAGILLLSVVVVQIIANRRTRRMAVRLRESNDELIKERDSLKKTQADLVAARDRASKAVRQKTEFIHNVSHEINEPVKAIVGFTQLIVDSIPEQRRRYLNSFIDLISQNSRILQRIAGDILDTAEIEDTVTNITVTHFMPEEVCRSASDSLRPRLNENQTLTVEPMKIIGDNGEQDYGIDTDASRLEQILVNIIGNAIKFCDKGNIFVSPEIDFEKGLLNIAVTDEGPGIPAGKEELIFGRFEKLGHYADGLGLGLYVSRELARLLEGDVKVDIHYKGGARIIITLPISIRPSANV